jgi:hypothetical protein
MNNSFVLAIIIDLAILASQCIVGAETPQLVDSLDGLRAAIKKASPGSVIEVSDGVDWEFAEFLLQRRPNSHNSRPDVRIPLVTLDQTVGRTGEATGHGAAEYGVR